MHDRKRRAVAGDENGVIIVIMKKTSSHRTPQDALCSKHDPVLRLMQTPKARKGMRAAFNTSPSELGRAAVEAGRKSR